MNIETSPQQILETLGKRLKRLRLTRNESQQLFASRIGLSRQSYAKMEQGSPNISIGHWLNACHILGKLDSWENILKEESNLFAQFEAEQSTRKRASSSRRTTK